MSVPKSERKPSGFAVVDTALSIYGDILDICLRMPNRYTYLILLPILNLANDVADYVKGGNSIIPNSKAPNPVDVNLRRMYFQKARAALQALISKMNVFLLKPDVVRRKGKDGKTIGITENELNSLAEKMRSELSLIGGVLEKDEKRYNTKL